MDGTAGVTCTEYDEVGGPVDSDVASAGDS